MRLAKLAFFLAACGPPSVPEHPTWADVEPILRGNCTHCHGASAGTSVRLDFFDMNDSVCGSAAKALDKLQLAHGLAPLIADAISPPQGGGRARMPPAPAPALADWERETLLRWAENPTLGTPPRENRRPQVTVTSELVCTIDDRLDFTLLIDDPDGEPVVGVLTFGTQDLELDGPGSFHVNVDTSGWPTGRYPLFACVCDGWDQASYALPEIVVVH